MDEEERFADEEERFAARVAEKFQHEHQLIARITDALKDKLAEIKWLAREGDTY